MILTVAIAVRCAHPGTPSGGPKDVTPPMVVATSPENGSAGFSAKKFIIEFDEFVSLENIQQAALISPPMKNMPEFLVKGKSVQVKFKEDLKPNTTYSVFFGDAIVDITERNPLSNYTYIFSTGDYVDSLSLDGHVNNAFDLKPVEGVFVMLYKDNNDTIVFDSLPYFVVPYYLSKTGADGKFRFNGLSGGNYLLFALNDKNSNYIFDQPSEEIAFLDSLVQPVYVEKPKIDSTLHDSIMDIEMTSDSIIVIADSLLTDSICNEDDTGIGMYLFLTPDTIQRLLKAEVIEKNKIRFSFSQLAIDVGFEHLKVPPDGTWHVVGFSTEKDTLYWYLNNPPTDSLVLLLTQFDDTLGTVYLKLDPEKKLAGRRKKEKKEILGWKSNMPKQNPVPGKHPEIQFAQPNVRFNNIDSTLLVIGSDSIWDPEFSFVDSLHMGITFPLELEEETQYRIYFPDSSFTSWNNIHTEAIDISFSTLPLSDYGIFTFHLHPEKKRDYILQMLSEDEAVLRDFYFDSDTSVTFLYVKPSKYLFKIICDNNSNHKWDAGNYGLKIQPEEVLYYGKDIKVRANWEVEEDWAW